MFLKKLLEKKNQFWHTFAAQRGQRSSLLLTSVIPHSHENVKPFAAPMNVFMWFGVGVV